MTEAAHISCNLRFTWLRMSGLQHKPQTYSYHTRDSTWSALYLHGFGQHRCPEPINIFATSWPAGWMGRVWYHFCRNNGRLESPTMHELLTEMMSYKQGHSWKGCTLSNPNTHAFVHVFCMNTRYHHGVICYQPPLHWKQCSENRWYKLQHCIQIDLGCPRD